MFFLYPVYNILLLIADDSVGEEAGGGEAHGEVSSQFSIVYYAQLV